MLTIRSKFSGLFLYFQFVTILNKGASNENRSKRHKREIKAIRGVTWYINRGRRFGPHKIEFANSSLIKASLSFVRNFYSIICF